MPKNPEHRLRRIEERLAEIEEHLGVVTDKPGREPLVSEQLPTPTQTPTPLPTRPQEHAPAPITTPPARERRTGNLPTTVLGVGGVAALVMAAAYLIQLAIDSGFLTPARQVGMATLFGIGLIVAGRLLEDKFRRYASLLPAGGVVVLFLSVYGGHLYHNLFGAMPAAIGVVLICIISLWLREHSGSELYTFFAVAGSYTGPFLLHILAARPMDLMIYFGLWDILFCVYALRIGWRTVYLVSAYLALVMFDATWRSIEHTDWIAAASFQAVQFVLFLAVTAWFSIRHRRPLQRTEDLWHLPPLVIFYALEYSLFSQHIPRVAPWLAMASMLPPIVVYVIAQSRTREKLRTGEAIVTAYVAMVLFHAGYMELVPDGWRELTGFAALVLLGLSAYRNQTILRRFWPLTLAMSVTAAIGYAHITTGIDLKDTVAWRALIPLYAVVLYTAYWLVRTRAVSGSVAGAILYLGHFNVMAGIAQLSDSRLIVSIVWGLLAIATLVISITTGDRRLGRSSLLVFAAFAAKVLLLDLSGASPLVRIGCLVVLGVTMYAGGMLYQRINRAAPSTN